MDKKEVITILKKSIIPVILIAGLTACISVLVIQFFNILPQTYIVQSQLVINPKVSKAEDSTKSMELLKYNENYSLLVYSYDFLGKLTKSNTKLPVKDMVELKSKVKVLSSPTSQVLTLQVSLHDEKKGIKLCNIMLEELYREGNRLFTHSELTVLSRAATVNITTYSSTLLLTLMFFMILGVELSLVFYYQYYERHKHIDNKRRRNRNKRQRS